MTEPIVILLVDDDPNMRETLADIFELKGYHVVTAENGRDAVDRAREREFTNIIMDIKMPEMNGVEATQKIRSFNENVPVTLMTAYAFDTLDKNILTDLSCSFIEKPFDPKKLLVEIETPK